MSLCATCCSCGQFRKKERPGGPEVTHQEVEGKNPRTGERDRGHGGTQPPSDRGGQGLLLASQCRLHRREVG